MDIGEFDFLRKDEILEILCSNNIPYKMPFTKMKDIIYSIVELLSTTDLKILEIIKKVNESYNVKYVMNDFTKDMHHYMVNIMAESIGMSNIKEKYEIDYEEVQERMFFRIELYKDGWEPEQIEKYICKYILKCDYHNTDKDLVLNMYHNIMEKLKISNKNKPKKVGRPNLPESLKKYIKGKHSEKTKKNMDLTYDYSKKYKQIKDNLLTEDEYKFLYEYLKTFPVSFNKTTTMIEKLRNLKIDDNI
jgi:hypothetical protein